MRNKIIRELYSNPHGYISGSKLANKLGISRVAVWKHIEALKKKGYNIEGTSGKGYRIKNPGNVWLLEELEVKLAHNSMINKILFYPKTDSSNQIAKQMLSENKDIPGTLIIAGNQTKGRGRRGRSWESPPGGLWFSLILSPRLALQQTALLSLVFAVAVAEALDNFLPGACQIKWPNDVYCRGKKIAGILLEVTGEVDLAESLIVGVGINANVKAEMLTLQTSQAATSLLEETNKACSLEEVLVTVLSSMEKSYHQFQHDGFGHILEEFKKRCCHLGKDIVIELSGERVMGKNVDIDHQGNLLICVNGQIQHLATGDVKLI